MTSHKPPAAGRAIPVFKISPKGRDSAPRGPWRSFTGARDALRALRRSGTLTGPVRVEVAPGVYRLTEPLRFGPEDSHTTYAAAKDGTAILDGGRELSGWKLTTHNGRPAWTIHIPEAASGALEIRSLFINGQRRPRARYPKFSPDAEGAARTLRIGEIRFPEKRKLFDGDHMFKPRPGDVQNWPSLRHAEIVLLHYWVETRLPDPFLDPETGWICCSRRSVFNLYESFNPKLARYYIDNLAEALTDPGEWYLDRVTGRLTYLPLPGETPAAVTAVIPVVTRLLDVSGEAFNRGANSVTDPLSPRHVEGLRFEGLVFRHSDWYLPPASMLSHDAEAIESLRGVPLGSAPQAAAHVPGVIRFRWSRDCALTRCAITNTGFTAIEAGPGCRGIEISRNQITHIGGGGVKIGGAELDGPPADRTSRVLVTDNTIRHVGRVFHQSCGILLTCAFECGILHNEIAHTCYTGVSVGWSWGYRDTITRAIRVENNLIHDICEGVLSDNGGIYLLGVQPGTVVRGNHIFRVTAADYGGWGIYPDEGSSHIVFEHNWVHDTSGASFSIHFGRDLIVRHNVFARPGEAFFNVNRAEGAIAANLFHNIFLGPAKALFSSGYQGDILTAVESNANIFSFPPDQTPPLTCPDYRKDLPRSRPFTAWRKAGLDRLSVFTPLKIRETPQNLIFPASSPARAAGFKPYNWSVCGPRPMA